MSILIKIKQDTIPSGHIFQIIHTKYSLNQPDIDKIYLYAEDPYEAKYQYLINKREKVGLDHFKDPKAFIEYEMICKMFTKMSKITIQERNVKC